VVLLMVGGAYRSCSSRRPQRATHLPGY
jgi:hypothetical protein